MRLACFACAVGLALACAGCGGGAKAPAAKPPLLGLVLTPAVSAPAFTLTDQNGKAVRMTAERGHYVVVTFLYTHCPDVCPVIAGMLNGVLKTPVAMRGGLRVLAISVDPKGDTPAAVRQFVRVHQLLPSFHYLTGTRPELQPVWSSFHVASTSGPDAEVSHSAIEYLIDPQGRERLIYDSTVTTATVVHDLSLLEADGHT
jgi:protein SCO1/2